MPIQDNFNQLQFLQNGLSRIEYIALQFYTNNDFNDTIKECIILAAKFIDEIEDYKTSLTTKSSNLQIIP
jgi:hypothetical protein